MKAIILAGGFGTRLASVVNEVPKPMASVLGRPFLSWIFDQLERQGFTEIILAVHYRHKIIREFFGNQYSSLKIKYVVEEKPLGTGGAILNALQDIPLDEPCFVLNGDSYLDAPLGKMSNIYEGHDMVLSLRKVKDCSRYGQAIFKGHKISHFNSPGENKAGWINAGIYFLSKRIFDILKIKDSFSFEKEVLGKNLQNISCNTIKYNNDFIDIGVPEDYAAASGFLENIQKSYLT